jgi:hypothetical protein
LVACRQSFFAGKEKILFSKNLFLQIYELPYHFLR